MGTRIDFIKKQKESFNDDYDYLHLSNELDELNDLLERASRDFTREGFKEGLWKKIKKGFKSAGDFFSGVDWNKAINNPVADRFKKFGEKIGGAFEEMFKKIEQYYKFLEDSNRKTANAIKDAFKRFSFKKFAKSIGIQDLIQGFKDIEKFFETFPKRIDYIFGGIGKIFIGVIQSVEGIFNGIGLGVLQVGELLEYIGEFIFTYLKCSVKMLQNLWGCFFYYIVELCLQILYLPFRIMLFCSKEIFGVDLYGRERQAFEGLYDMSYLMYKYTGYHFMYWPKPIRERCFVCVRLKTSTVEWKANEVDKAFTQGLPREMKRGEFTIMQAVEYIKAAFTGNMKVKQLSKGDPIEGGAAKKKKKSLKDSDFMKKLELTQKVKTNPLGTLMSGKF